MRISVDFDGTLTRKDVQKVVRDLMKDGHEVIVITSRTHNNELVKFNAEVFTLCATLSVDNLYFTEGEYKFKFTDTLKPVVHLDDDNTEVQLINKQGSANGTLAINIKDPSWKQQLNNILNPSSHYKKL